GEIGAAVQGHQTAVDVGTFEGTWPQRPYHRVLSTEGARAPKPVGVPTPQVVVDGEVVAGPLVRVARDGAVVDVPARVVTGPGCLIGEPGQGQVQLVGAECHTVHEVDRLPLVAGVRADPFERVHGLRSTVEPQMAQMYVR